MEKIASEDLRKIASDLRKTAEQVKKAKMIKSAKYLLGLSAIKQLERKLKGK